MEKAHTPRPHIKLNEVGGRSPSSMSPSHYSVAGSPSGYSQLSVSNVSHQQILLDDCSITARAAETSKCITDIKNYSLQDWREYSLLRFANTKRFHKSPHGRRIIVADTLRDYGKDLRLLVNYVDEMEKLAKEAESRLIEERELRRVTEDMLEKAQYKLGQLSESYAELENQNKQLLTLHGSPKRGKSSPTPSLSHTASTSKENTSPSLVKGFGGKSESLDSHTLEQKLPRANSMSEATTFLSSPTISSSSSTPAVKNFSLQSDISPSDDGSEQLSESSGLPSGIYTGKEKKKKSILKKAGAFFSFGRASSGSLVS